MLKEDLYQLKALINEYGARGTLVAFIKALEENADEYSDMGLKERAREAAEVAEAMAAAQTTITS